MQRRRFFDTVSRRAPKIVLITLCAALVAYWTDAPLWLPYGLALIVGVLAFVLMAGRERLRVPVTGEGSGTATEKSWIAYELAGKGSPSGSYLLGFFSLVTVTLTGFEGAYASPAWAGLALAAAWGFANARYPAGEEGEE